jgi:stalled ribosome rescue protein Dom34
MGLRHAIESAALQGNTMNKHATVWIDHKEARVFHIHPDKVLESNVYAPEHDTHKRPKGAEGVRERPNDAHRFFHDVALTLDGTDTVLIVGPSTAKLEFFRYVHKHHHALEPKIIGIETVDHPTDGQIIAYARKYFKLGERTRPE